MGSTMLKQILVYYVCLYCIMFLYGKRLLPTRHEVFHAQNYANMKERGFYADIYWNKF